MKQRLLKIRDQIPQHLRWQIGWMLGMAGVLFSLFYDAGSIVHAWSLPKVSMQKRLISNANVTDRSQIFIPAQHLFGVDTRLQSAAVPETGLQLTLTGILKSTGGQASAAIIAENDELGKVYQEGSVLPGGAVLEAIRDDQVVIKNQGHYEKLVLSRPPALLS